MLSVEIANYLHNKGIGIFDPTGTTGNIFIMTMASSPDSAIGIYPRGGPPSDGKLGYDNISIELWIRGADATETSDRAQRIYNLFHGFHSRYFIPLGTYVVSCLCDQGSPNYISKDENKRFEFSINLSLEIKNFEGSRDNGNTGISLPITPYIDLNIYTIVSNGLIYYMNGLDFTNTPIQTYGWLDRSNFNNITTMTGFSYTASSGSDLAGNVVFDGVNDQGVANIPTNQVQYTIVIKGVFGSIASWKAILSTGGTLLMANRIATLYYTDTSGTLSFTTKGSTNLLFVVPLNTEIEICLTYDGIMKRAYINGVLSVYQYDTPYTQFTNYIFLGTETGATHSNPIIKTVKYYKRKLEVPEILQNYTNG